MQVWLYLRTCIHRRKIHLFSGAPVELNQNQLSYDTPRISCPYLSPYTNEITRTYAQHSRWLGGRASWANISRDANILKSATAPARTNKKTVYCRNGVIISLSWGNYFVLSLTFLALPP